MPADGRDAHGLEPTRGRRPHHRTALIGECVHGLARDVHRPRHHQMQHLAKPDRQQQVVVFADCQTLTAHADGRTGFGDVDRIAGGIPGQKPPRLLGIPAGELVDLIGHAHRQHRAPRALLAVPQRRWRRGLARQFACVEESTAELDLGVGRPGHAHAPTDGVVPQIAMRAAVTMVPEQHDLGEQLDPVVGPRLPVALRRAPPILDGAHVPVHRFHDVANRGESQILGRQTQRADFPARGPDALSRAFLAGRDVDGNVNVAAEPHLLIVEAVTLHATQMVKSTAEDVLAECTGADGQLLVHGNHLLQMGPDRPDTSQDAPGDEHPGFAQWFCASLQHVSALSTAVTREDNGNPATQVGDSHRRPGRRPPGATPQIAQHRGSTPIRRGR